MFTTQIWEQLKMPLCPYCDENCDEDIGRGVAVPVGTSWMHQACHKQFTQDQDALYIQEMTKMYGHAWVIANVAAAISENPKEIAERYGLPALLGEDLSDEQKMRYDQ